MGTTASGRAGPAGRSSAGRRPPRRNRRGPLSGGPARRGHGHRRWPPRSPFDGASGGGRRQPSTFLRKRRDGSPAMLASCTCTMTQTGTSWMSGRKTRTIPAALRRALSARDTRCRFPGCSARRCDAHHIEHWVEGGTTSLANLRVAMPAPSSARPRGRLHFATTAEFDDGLLPSQRPPGSARAAAAAFRPGHPLAPTTERLTANGITISPRSLPTWDGAPFNLVHAIDVLYVAPAENG